MDSVKIVFIVLMVLVIVTMVLSFLPINPQILITLCIVVNALCILLLLLHRREKKQG